MPSTLAIRHLAACLRGALFTTRFDVGQAHTTSQLVCVGRCLLGFSRQMIEYRPTRPSRVVTLPRRNYVLVMNMAQPRQARLWPKVDGTGRELIATIGNFRFHQVSSPHCGENEPTHKA